jgi:hypothetical protein
MGMFDGTVSWRSGFAPPATPLARRLLVYFRSGAYKYLYVTTSQHDRRPEFHDGEELRQQPYGLFRVYVGSLPIRAMER